MIDRKGISAYLIITFALTYAIEGALIWSGFRIASNRPCTDSSPSPP